MAFALMIGYNILIKEKERWITLLFASVFVVNLGYFCIAIADTLQGALMANRIAEHKDVMLLATMYADGN